MQHPDPAVEAAGLPALLLALHRARSALEDQRGVQLQPHASLSARNELLVALEMYIEGLESTRRPVPYRLRDELRLRRALRASPYAS